MNTLYVVLFFIFGTIFGSFFGVVGSRVPNNESIVTPSSHCNKCSHELKWYELIPIFSYIIQGGKCSKCGSSIPILYPITELISGLLFAVSYFCFGFSTKLFIALLVASLLVIVIITDVTYLIIPDEVTLTFSILVILVKLISLDFRGTFYSILSGILLFSLMYCIMILGNKLFKKETLGGADIKLMFFVGLVVFPSLGIFTIFLSSCLALPVSLYLLLKDKNSIIPYGPFILMALFLVYCFN